MRDQSTYPFDVCILRLIPYKKYNQHFSSYFYVDIKHELANYALLFALWLYFIYLFCKLLFIFVVSNGK